MKKFIAIAAVVFTMTACNTGANTEAPATTDSTKVDSCKVDTCATTVGTTTGTTTTVAEPVKAAK